MAGDFLKILQEIRGTGLPEAAYTDGIYHDIVEKTTEDDNVTARLGAGLYGSMQAMYVGMAGIISIQDELAILEAMSAELHSLYLDKATLDSLYADKIALDSIYADKATIDSLVADKLTLDSLYADKATLDSLFADKAKLDSIFTDKIKLDSLYADKIKLDSLYDDKLTIDGLYGMKTTLDSLFADKITLDSLYTDKATLDSLYADKATLDAVFANKINIDTVATDIASVITVAGQIDSVTTYTDTYYGALAAAPTIGSHPTLAIGGLYFDTVAKIMKVYSENGWINAGSAVNGTVDRYVYVVGTASGDYDGISLTTFPAVYDVGFVDVFVEGIKLVNGTDFTAASGLDVTIVSPLTSGMDVEVIGYGAFDLTNAAQIQAMYESQPNKVLDQVTSLQLDGGIGTQGTMTWNADEETADLVLNGAILQIGQETNIHCRNSTGLQIDNGTVVMATGTLGASGRITIAPWDGVSHIKYILGVTTVDIPAGEDGKVTNFGKVRDIDTSAFLEGDILYAAASGALTKIEPANGVHAPMAFVINVHATNGSIMVRFTPIDGNDYEHSDSALMTYVQGLDDLVTYSGSDVTITGNLTVSGGTTTVDSTTVTTADNLIVINAGEVGTGVTNGEAGIQIDRGLATDYEFKFDETDDSFKIGEIGSLQKVATREDTPTDTGIAVWDTAKSKFVTTTSPAVSDVIISGTSLGTYLDFTTAYEA